MSRRPRFDAADNSLSSEEIVDEMPKEETIDEAPMEKEVELVVKDCQRLNVRRLPSTDSPVVLEVTAGTRLIRIGGKSNSGWTEVKTSIGEIKTGHVMSQFVEEILDG